MKYTIAIQNRDGKTENIEGSDVDETLQRAARKYYSLKYSGQYFKDSQTKRLTNEIKKTIANSICSEIQAKIENRKKLIHNFNNLEIDIWGEKENKIKSQFTDPLPNIENITYPKLLEFKDAKPQVTDVKYLVTENIFYKIFENLFLKKVQKKKELFESDLELWDKKRIQTENENNKLLSNYKQQLQKAKEIFLQDKKQWEENRDKFFSENKEYLDFCKSKSAFQNGNKVAIERYVSELFNYKIDFLDFWDKEIFVQHNPENKIVFVEYLLPSTNDINNIKEVKYIQTKDQFAEILMKQSDFEKHYDEIIYQISISMLYLICVNDTNDNFESVALNGYVKTINKASGDNIKPCIVSLFVKKEDILKLNLMQIDPKICFKNLKGVSASTLANQSAIPPIILFDKTDKRFIEAKEIVGTLNNSINLASMDWNDFEHLIREIFEKEFSINGGEVKVTQASRDGGVDAIAFDPDPIRGGKIVIQAKRYTNTVGVNAVRDLYGTILNEGATKGILVTTSDYGSDAYEFSKDKPITLLNGSNLLHLLEKHGHQARIDLLEAKKSFSK